MIFRTGSILIVGKCSESTLIMAYQFIKDLLYNEYDDISMSGVIEKVDPKKNTKVRKKTIYTT